MVDFHTVQVAFDDKVHAPHMLFFKRHFSKEDKTQRTVFISNNIPPYCNEDGLRNVFRDCGKIESVIIKENPNNTSEENFALLNNFQVKNECFQMAYIVFKDEESIETMFELNPSAIQIMSRSDQPISTGVNKWIKEHNNKFPSESSIQSCVDEFMRNFDKTQAEKEDAKNNEGADNDGWVTIPVKNKIGSETNKLKKINKKLEKKKQKEKELKNFYLFQQREEKREKIANLRQKFLEDKKTIAQLQNSRKFKPF